jgi:hypothetical protein
MNDLPSTIKHPETFLNSPAAGFDGVFDWSWTDGCLGSKNITPMDFDGVVERKGNFLLFETKGINVPIPRGQMYTFESAYNLGCFTIMFIEGKGSPEKIKAWCQPGFYRGVKAKKHSIVTDLENAKSFVKAWYSYADNNRAVMPNISFLNKKIVSLGDTISEAKKNAEKLVLDLGGKVYW